MGRRPVLQRRAEGPKGFVVPELMEDGQRILAAITRAQAVVKQLQADMRKIHERLERGFGPHYESRVARNTRCTLGRHAGIRNAGVRRGANPGTDRKFENAETNGVITEQESDDLWLLDLLAWGTRRKTRETVYVGVEVSITDNGGDGDRAASRAETLRKVTWGPVMAVVIASRMNEPCRKLALHL